MKKKIEALEQQRFHYLINKEYDEFTAMCDAELRYVHSNGAIDTLDSYLQHLKSGYYEYQALSYDINKVIDMHDHVIATGDFFATVLVDGNLKELKNRALSIWKKEGSEFRFLMYQGTPFVD